MAHYSAGAAMHRAFSFAIFSVALAVNGAATAEPHDGGRIGYVLTERHWAVYETEGAKTECPHGMNDRGSRALFDHLFTKDKQDATRTVAETRLVIEGMQFHPTLFEQHDPLPFYEAQGQISYGLNLDGKVGETDFKSPAGEEGIDNQLYRVIGCIPGYRRDGPYWFFENDFMTNNAYNRWMIEVSNVDDLVNDDDVTVTTYRGLDRLLTDATGEGIVPGGSQRIDWRWGQSFIAETKGKIVDGVLITEPIKKIKFPWSQGGVSGGYHIFRDFQLQLKLTAKTAEGILGGYVDVDQFNHRFSTTWSMHHQNYGQSASVTEYPALRRLADAYPDPETGANTAISAAVDVVLTQVYILHPSADARAR